MTRKDYQAIATILHQNDMGHLAHGNYSTTYPPAFITELADYMANDNPNFNRDKFIKACYNG